ncbi:MAG TPA: hypothetical protein DEP92_03210 [Candidatus Komeilibacteria bacterium]|nr:hypothetical protein [Candidatus Komeilibacteria bacterium]
MRNLEFKIFNTDRGGDVSKEQEAEKLLESETNINYGILRKIADNPTLRKAFYIVAFSVGLLIGQETLAQQKLEKDGTPDNTNIENVIQEREDIDIEQVIREFAEYIKNSEHFSEYPHSMMSWAAAAEKPTEFQARQIIDLHNKISEATQSQKFKSTTELMAFVNCELDSNFSSQKSYVNLKDVFSEKEGQEPKANFDCDSRAIMVSSILQNMGYTNEDVVMCEIEGHMIMYSKKESVYFETTTNKVVELTQEQKAQLNHITTPEKYFGHLLSNQGTALALEAESDWFRGHIDKDKREKAAQKLKQAIELDSGNITAKLNLIYLLTRGERDTEKLNIAAKLHRELLSDLVYNYHGIGKPQENKSPTFKAKPQQEILDYEPTFKDLSLKAIQESDYIKDKFNDYADFAYFEADNYQESITMYKLLLESLPKDEKGSITADFYRAGVAHSQFNNGDFDSYLAEIDNTMKILSSGKNAYYLERDLKRLEKQKLVAEILSGKLIISEDNIESIIEQYKNDPVLGPVISGEEHWNANYMEPVEALRGWGGYENLKKLIETCKASKN